VSLMTIQTIPSQLVPVAAPPKLIAVRPAEEADVQAIADIVNANARQGHLLPRSPDNIRASLANWLVAEADGVVVGIGSLLSMSPTLVEIRSLAVLPAFRRYGVGAQVVNGLVGRARERGIPTVFALTRAVPFFERMGFSITAKERFPEKVWTDCVICPLKDACDETAVVLEL
ncbi:MAG TPA: GNAT family N-acetyltransferase, partial [Roseiflexaceae bacterium]|nr:GNAT family N-acetyltransferase [Roseiflexaceae bacterium]